MSATKDGGPAFPQPNHIVDTDRGREEARGWMADSGMTLRDWFAGQNVAGLISNPAFQTDEDDPKKVPQELARLGYELADAMLAEREKGQQ